MHTRIAAVISHSGLTKTAFGQRINLSQSMVSRLALGTTSPSDRTIADICREFNVNETWLRTGEGEMFILPDADTELANFCADVLSGVAPPLVRAVVALLADLTDEEVAVLSQIRKRISAKWQTKNDTE